MATGNYPGKARTADELRADLDKAYSLIPGKHRLALHAMYLEAGGKKVDRNEVAPEHFGELGLAGRKENGLGLDFNPTYFSHPQRPRTGFTLANRDEGIRKFLGRTRYRLPEGGRGLRSGVGNAVRDERLDTRRLRRTRPSIAPRRRFGELRKNSLDAIFTEPQIDPAHNLDALEGKLFGIGSESYVVGSHEFYLSYARHARRNCSASTRGTSTPPSTVADKVSSLPDVPGRDAAAREPRRSAGTATTS